MYDGTLGAQDVPPISPRPKWCCLRPLGKQLKAEERDRLRKTHRHDNPIRPGNARRPFTGSQAIASQHCHRTQRVKQPGQVAISSTKWVNEIDPRPANSGVLPIPTNSRKEMRLIPQYAPTNSPGSVNGLPNPSTSSASPLRSSYREK